MEQQINISRIFCNGCLDVGPFDLPSKLLLRRLKEVKNVAVPTMDIPVSIEIILATSTNTPRSIHMSYCTKGNK